MAKRISQLTALTAANIATNDLIAIVDVSAGVTKKTTVAELVGIPDVANWVATGETWTYSSYSSGTRLGVITVPTDATTKYSIGMRVRISQSTGGTKYGTIVGVTATTLTVWFASYTLNNETISSPVYSPMFAPFGFPVTPYTDANGWSQTVENGKRVYRKEVSYNQSQGTAISALTLSSSALPAGLSTVGTAHYFVMGVTNTNGNSAYMSQWFEHASGAAGLAASVRSHDTTRTWAGIIALEFREK